MCLEKLKNIEVIFFDMGNTLLHFHEGISDEQKDDKGLCYMLEYLQKEHGFRGDFDEFKKSYLPFYNELLRKRVENQCEYPVEEHLNEFLKSYDIEVNREEAHHLMMLFIKEYHSYMWIENDLQKTLSTLVRMGFKIGIISNTYLPDEIMIDFFKTTGLHKFIDSYTFSYYLRIRKPRVEIFESALGKMNCLAEHAIMIGDKLKEDVWGAQEAGLKAIWYNKNGKVNDSSINPNFEIQNIRELMG